MARSAVRGRLYLMPAVAAVAAMLAFAPAGASGPGVMFLTNGEEVDGWSWLRDADGSQYATWSFWGSPTGEPLAVTAGLLATDGVNGGPGVDARTWLTIGAIESGGPGPALLGPSLVTFPNVSAADDPVGYTTLGSVTILPEELSPTMEGVWVLVERRGPDGSVLPEHIAVNRDAIAIDGLALPGGCPGACPSASPSPSA